MSNITVHVEDEEKEISGLNKKTTCRDVLQALLQDRQAEIETNKDNGQSFSKDDLEIKNSSNLRDLAKDYVIVESWRGCEKILPLRTKLFAVWQAWGNEQCHVRFTLKKDKNARYRTSRHSNSKEEFRAHTQQGTFDSTSYIQNLSQDDKKRIRRNLMQHQRWILNKQSQENIDGNNNADANSKRSAIDNQNVNLAGERILSSRQKLVESSKSDLVSEEQFVDGEMTGPECILRHDVRNKFLLNAADKSFNKERCTYRRPHHRRRSLLLEDSDGVTDQNVVLSQPLNDKLSNHSSVPKSRKRSSTKRRHRSRRSPGRVSKHSSKLKSEKYSTESTTSSASVTLSSEPEGNSHSEGEDADDEKSILADTNSPLNRQKMTQYPICDEICCVDSGSASTATITDSSSGNTTCSETSNTSGSSFTTSSSDASSGIDFESYLDKRQAATAAVAANKSPSVNKPKSGTAKLFKPAQNLFSSFMKKKKSNVTNQLTRPIPAATVVNKPQILKTLIKTSAEGNVHHSFRPTTDLLNKPLAEYSKKNEAILSNAENQECPNEANEKVQLNQVQQLIVTQEQELSKRNGKLAIVNNEIETLQSTLNQAKSDIKIPPSLDKIADKKVLHRPQESCQIKWIQECTDLEDLEKFTSFTEKIVSNQIEIEKQKQKAQILLQEINNFAWISSAETNIKMNNSYPAADLDISNRDDECSSDEESSSNIESLCVSAGKSSKPMTSPPDKQIKDDTIDDVEHTRTELEANLYLGLRLSTELKEVDKLMYKSQQLLQSKGEALLNLMREIAQGDDGISPELWDEYGDLLTAYDAEVALQQYLATCAESDITRHRQIDFDIPISRDNNSMEAINKLHSNSLSEGLHHALSPWLWCEHCKNELAMSQSRGEFLTSNGSRHSSHWLTHSSIPSDFSSLPLPYPTIIHDQRQPPSTRLLPMPPVPDCVESDYEEVGNKSVHSKIENGGATSTIISTEDVIPRGIVLHFPHHSFQQAPFPCSDPANSRDSSPFQNGSSNADDSGNASAESTASFASTNSDCTDLGSRNGSCDGGSPPPALTSIENQDTSRSASFLQCGNLIRNSGKSKFAFTSQLKLGKTDQHKTSLSKLSHRAETMHLNNVENECMNLSKKLSRRNSGKAKRASPMVNINLHKRATSFGKGAIKPPHHATQVKRLLNNPIVNNTHCNLARQTNCDEVQHSNNDQSKLKTGNVQKTSQNPPGFQSPLSKVKTSNTNDYCNHKMPTFNMLSESKGKGVGRSNGYQPTSFDNDSDTGLSSLHSTDSCDRLCPPVGESLV